MVLTLDKVARKVAQRVGDRNNDKFAEIKGYVEDTVNEITGLMRKGAAYATASVTITDSEGTLPTNCAAVLKIYDGSTFYEFVDLDQYRSRAERSSQLPTVQAIEDAPAWRIRLLNHDSTTVTVDYLISDTNPSILPTYYQPLLLAGAVAKFHLNRSTPEVYREHKQFYKDLTNQFKENQVYNEGRRVRMKGLPEIEIAEPNNSLLTFQTNDYMSSGGPF